MAETLSTRMFGKDVHELAVADIVAYFETPKRETDTIEFKSYVDDARSGSTKPKRDAQKVNDIIKTICGFLNTDGGILIWGAPTPTKTEGEEDTYSGNLTPVDYKIEADQFTGVIASEISPTPLRVLFQPIRVAGEKSIYILEVNKSEFAPHQYKGTYYMRLDGSTRHAPHRYVEALIKRISYPKLEAFLDFGTFQNFRAFAGLPVQLTIHNLSKLINEKNLFYQIRVLGGDLIPINAQHVERKNKTTLIKEASKILHYNLPVVEHFLLVTDKMLQKSASKKIEIFLTIWGDLSPALVSKYNLSIFNDGGGRNTYTLEKKEENVYLIDKPHDLPDSERIKELNKGMFEIFEKEITGRPLIQHVRRTTGE